MKNYDQELLNILLEYNYRNIKAAKVQYNASVFIKTHFGYVDMFYDKPKIKKLIPYAHIEPKPELTKELFFYHNHLEAPRYKRSKETVLAKYCGWWLVVDKTSAKLFRKPIFALEPKIIEQLDVEFFKIRAAHIIRLEKYWDTHRHQITQYSYEIGFKVF